MWNRLPLRVSDYDTLAHHPSGTVPLDSYLSTVRIEAGSRSIPSLGQLVPDSARLIRQMSRRLAHAPTPTSLPISTEAMGGTPSTPGS